MLAKSLEKLGFQIIKGEKFSLSFYWLIKNRKKIGIIHLHYVQPLYCNRENTKANLFYVLKLAINLEFAKLLGYRVIFTLHNLTPTTPLRPKWIDYLGHWFAVNLSSRVIVHCSEAQRLLANYYHRKRKVYIVDHPNFIDQYPNEISKSEARKKIGFPDNALVYSFFGGIRPNKGIEILIQAFIKLKNPDYRLLIAGDAKTMHSYERMLEKMSEKDKRIFFISKFIADDEIQVILNAADIVVLPFSRILTSGSAILALSFARPVIVPRLGCLPELINSDSGWVLENNDVDTLSQEMELASTQDFKQFGINGYNSIKKFSYITFGIQTAEVYLD